MIVGGTAAIGIVNQGVVGEANATSVDVSGDLLFGNVGTGAAFGGNYNLNSGTLSVGGDIAEGVNGTQNNAVNTANLQINSATVDALSVAGSNITLQSLNVAAAGTNVVDQTLTNKDIDISGTLRVGQATGTNGTLTLSGGTTNITNANIAQDGTSQGTLNLTDGVDFVSSSRFYIAGDGNAGADEATMGTVNINTGSTFTVQSGNTEVGRDGMGFLNIDGAGTVYNQGTNSLILGQSGAGDDLSRGTVTFSNGALINIGAGTTSDVNFNGGGGTIVQSGTGTTVNIARNLNMGTVETGAAQNEYTISDGILDVGSNADIRASLFSIVGDTSIIDVGNNLTANDATTNLQFDFLGGSTVTDINVGGDANITGAMLSLVNDSALATYSSDIVLIDLSNGGTTSGQFAGLSEGDQVTGGYAITYNYQGNGSTALIQAVAVPEPSSITLFGLACAAMVGRRRRR